MDANQTYCGDHFVIYTNIELLYCPSETNMSIMPLKKEETILKHVKNELEKNHRYFNGDIRMVRKISQLRSFQPFKNIPRAHHRMPKIPQNIV